MPADDGGGAVDAVPGSHPEPPADLHERRPVITDGAGPWPRLHPGGLATIHFGRDPSRSGRFGAPEGEYGVMYAAEDEYGAFVETFGRDTGVRVIDEADLMERGPPRTPVPPRWRPLPMPPRPVASRSGALRPSRGLYYLRQPRPDAGPGKHNPPNPDTPRIRRIRFWTGLICEERSRYSSGGLYLLIIQALRPG